MLIVAVVGTFYTLLGGMWSVALTDGIQITLVLVGLVVLGLERVFAVGRWQRGGRRAAGVRRSLPRTFAADSSR